MSAKSSGLPSTANSMSPLAREVEAGRGDDDVGFQLLAGFQQDALLGEAVDLVGDDGGLAGLDALEQVAVGNERDALPPRPVFWREVGRDVVVLAEIGFDRRQQILLGRFRLLKGLAGEGVLVEQDFSPRDFVDPLFVDLQFPQLLGDLDRVAPGAEIGRRALQHGDMRAIVGHRRDQRRRGSARADHDDALVLVVEIFRPFLRMDDRALELGHVLPLRRIALGVAVIALAHPEEIGGEAKLLAGVGARGLDGPEIFLARPFRRGDGVLIADVRREIVLLDHVAHVFQDFRRRSRSALTSTA